MSENQWPRMKIDSGEGERMTKEQERSGIGSPLFHC